MELNTPTCSGRKWNETRILMENGKDLAVFAFIQSLSNKMLQVSLPCLALLWFRIQYSIYRIYQEVFTNYSISFTNWPMRQAADAETNHLWKLHVFAFTLKSCWKIWKQTENDFFLVLCFPAGLRGCLGSCRLLTSRNRTRAHTDVFSFQNRQTSKWAQRRNWSWKEVNLFKLDQMYTRIDRECELKILSVWVVWFGDKFNGKDNPRWSSCMN